MAAVASYPLPVSVVCVNGPPQGEEIFVETTNSGSDVQELAGTVMRQLLAADSGLPKTADVLKEFALCFEDGELFTFRCKEGSLASLPETAGDMPLELALLGGGGVTCRMIDYAVPVFVLCEGGRLAGREIYVNSTRNVSTVKDLSVAVLLALRGVLETGDTLVEFTLRLGGRFLTTTGSGWVHDGWCSTRLESILPELSGTVTCRAVVDYPLPVSVWCTGDRISGHQVRVDTTRSISTVDELATEVLRALLALLVGETEVIVEFSLCFEDGERVTFECHEDGGCVGQCVRKTRLEEALAGGPRITCSAVFSTFGIRHHKYKVVPHRLRDDCFECPVIRRAACAVLRGAAAFVDVSQTDALQTQKWASDAPKWRRACYGINLEGRCDNKNCDACGQMVVMPRNYDNFDLLKDAGTTVCPICRQPCKPLKPGFSLCLWATFGLKTDGTRVQTPWRTVGDCYETYALNESNEVIPGTAQLADFVRLQLRAKKLNTGVVPKALSEGVLPPKIVPVPKRCCICHEDMSCRGVVELDTCGHIFHSNCANKWLTSNNANAVCPLCQAPVAAGDLMDLKPAPEAVS